MNTELIRRHFEKIGASLRIDIVEVKARRHVQRKGMAFSLDIEESHNDERFLLSLHRDDMNEYEFIAVNVRPDIRHLLLMSRHHDTGIKRKYLCGHDERHWFVAGIPNNTGVSDVQQAMEVLKPEAALHSQLQSGVKRKNWNKRHNHGFIRQGEWFFVPDPSFEPGDNGIIHRNEPLRRGAGKPHIVSEICQQGGEMVYVNKTYPNGLTESQYRKLLLRRPDARHMQWTRMARNPTVHARGKVRHSDHKTIVLPFWHRVMMNGEWFDGTVAFLD